VSLWRRKPKAKVERDEQRAANRRALDAAAIVIRNGDATGPVVAEESAAPVVGRTLRMPALPTPKPRHTVDELLSAGVVQRADDLGAVPRPVSVAPRVTGLPLEKPRAVRSESLLAWVRVQPCMFRWSPLHQRQIGHVGGDPHHEPETGANGRHLDDCVAAACRLAHDLCEVSPSNGGWTDDQKEAAAHRTWVRFRRLAPLSLQVKVAVEVLASLLGETARWMTAAIDAARAADARARRT